MKDGTTNASDCTRRVLSDRQAEVLDELQVKGGAGVSDLYSRTLTAIKNRLIMDDEYDPAENLGLVRVLTMIEQDLRVLGEHAPENDEEGDQE